MIKQKGILKEEHAARHFAENQGDGRGASWGAGPHPDAWLRRTTQGHLELISIMSGII